MTQAVPLRVGQDDGSWDYEPHDGPWAEEARQEQEGSSWSPVDVGALFAAGLRRPEPTLLARDDGARLLYPGKVTAFAAEPETGKSFVAQLASGERIDAGEHVLYVDFEADATSVLERMAGLGPTPHELGELFHYVRPDEPLSERATNRLVSVLEQHRPTLAVVDGVAEAMALNDLDENKNADVAKFLVALPRLLERYGCCVLLIDHVVKDRESQGRWARGAGHKLAGVTAAYKLEPLRPFGRGMVGESKITLTKDRPGALGAVCPSRRAGTLVVDSTGADTRVSIRAPDSGPFRPTVLMERASRLLEGSGEALSGRQVREQVKGANDALVLALDLLVADGYVDRFEGPRRSQLHRSLRPFRADVEAGG